MQVLIIKVKNKQLQVIITETSSTQEMGWSPGFNMTVKSKKCDQTTHQSTFPSSSDCVIHCVLMNSYVKIQ